jgi:arginine repressor
MSTPSSPKRLVRDLIKRHRMSQTEITEALREDGIEVSQPTISRIANGREDIRLDLYRGLARLHERVSQPASA